MSAAGRWFITPHAIRRYIEKMAPQASFDEALARLIQLSDSAHRVRATRDGCAIYRAPRPSRIRLIVAERGPGLPQLVTVLAECDRIERTEQGAHHGQRQGR